MDIINLVKEQFKVIFSRKKQEKSQVFYYVSRLYKDFIHKYTPILALAVFFIGISGASSGLITYLIGPAINATSSDSPEHIRNIGLALIVIYGLKGVFMYIGNTLTIYTGVSITAKMQQKLHRHIIYQNLSYFNKKHSANLATVFYNNTRYLKTVASDLIINTVRDFFTLIGLMGAMFFTNWQFTLIFILFLGVVFVPIKFLRSTSHNLSAYNEKRGNHMGQTLQETFANIKLIKTYGLEKKKIHELDESINQIKRNSFLVFSFIKMTSPIMEIIVGASLGAIVIYASVYSQSHVNMDSASIFTFIASALLAYQPIKSLGNTFITVSVFSGALKGVYAILDDVSKLKISKVIEPVQLTSDKVDIEFKDVTFSYDNKTDVVKKASFKIPQGTHVAFIGKSGAGKSTIMQLLLRLFDIKSGKITLGGHDIVDIDNNQLRDIMSYVSQDTSIFTDTVRNNITLGDNRYTQEELVSAAKLANIYEFIEKLPKGFDTLLSESGKDLSGGQRQRISIARAAIKKSNILLLDEPTSALDIESESAIQASLQELCKGKTSITIAHRLSTIKESDIIFVMDDGKIITQGTHDDLLKSSEEYKRVYDLYVM